MLEEACGMGALAVLFKIDVEAMVREAFDGIRDGIKLVAN